jgi:hypothetical protein
MALIGLFSQMAMTLTMLSSVMPGVAGVACMMAAVTAWTVGADATADAAAMFGLLAPMFFLLRVVAVVSTFSMAGFGKAHHLLALLATRLLGMVLQVMLMTFAGEVALKLPSKAIVVAYMP